jgi:hypothetical protein
MIVRETMQRVAAQEVGATVSDVSYPHASSVVVSSHDGGAHAAVERRGVRCLIDSAVGSLDGPLQLGAARVGILDAVREAIEHAVDREAAGHFTGRTAAYAVAYDEESAVQIKAERVLVGLAPPANVARCCCSNPYLH